MLNFINIFLHNSDKECSIVMIHKEAMDSNTDLIKITLMFTLSWSMKTVERS